jgi:YggT family protein
VLNFQSGNFLVDLGELYILILLIRAVLSWFPYDPSSPLNGARRVLFTLTEPVLAPARRIIPPVGMVDISFLVVVIVLEILVTQVFARIPV